MPRLRVVALERVAPGAYRYLMWADVPASRQQFFASTGVVTSAYKLATSADIANIQSGAYVERVDMIEVGSTQSVAQVQAILADTWQSFQNGITTHNPWVFYGTNLNSTGGWTTTGVA